MQEGFRCVKLKVGIGDDAGRVAAARAGAGPRTQLRLDANGAWGVEEAVRAIDVLSPAGRLPGRWGGLLERRKGGVGETRLVVPRNPPSRPHPVVMPTSG